MSTQAYTETQQTGISPSPALSNTPDALRELPQWIGWRLEPPKKPGEKPRKVPINPHTGRRASTTDPATWGTLEEALAAVKRYRLTGIGFVFVAGGGLFGIDLDDCRDQETGQLQPWAVAILERFPMLYWEVSQSGTGLHGIGYGQLPPGRRRHDQIETYDVGRFFVMTGNTLPSRTTMGKAGETLAAWHAETFPPQPEATTLPRDETFTAGDTAAIIDRLRGERSGKAARLLAGDTSGYTSPSEARAALAWKACFYTSDPEQVAGIVRSSDLFSTGTPDRERDRRAARDAVEAVATYRGETWTPPTTARISTPEPPPTGHDRQPTGNRPDTGEGDTCTAELAAARARIADLERERNAARLDRDTLLALMLNPHVSSAEKMAIAATVDRARRKTPDADGYVTLKPGEIANDWRPKPEPGTNTAPLNRDGSKPRMNRGSVGKTLTKMRDAYGLKETIDSTAVKVEPKNGREPYKETVWKIRPKPIAEILAPIAFHQPATITPRAARTIGPQCPACGVDLEGVTIQTVTIIEGACPECGEVHRTVDRSKPRRVAPIVVLDTAGETPGDKFSPVQSVATPTGDNLSPSPRPSHAGPPILETEPPDYWTPPHDGPPPGTFGHDRYTA